MCRSYGHLYGKERNSDLKKKISSHDMCIHLITPFLFPVFVCSKYVLICVSYVPY